MKNPSHFGKQNIPEIHYNSNEFLNLKLHNDRYHISKTIGRQQSTYFHLGLDIFQKKEVIILRTLTTKYIRRTKQQNQTLKSLCLETCWIGEQRINGISYIFQVAPKKGCFFYEYLKTIKEISIRQFYTILALLMQFLKRLHKRNVNIREIDVKTLQICINNQTKSPEIMQVNKQSLSFGQCSNQPKRKSRNDELILVDKNTVKQSWVQKMNSKPSQKQDMKIMFQKIRQIETYLQRKKQIHKVQVNYSGKGNIVFQACLKQMLMFIKQQGLELESVETWLYCVGYFAHHHLKTNIDALKQPFRNIIEQATILNRIRIQNYLQSINNEQGDIVDLYSEELTYDEDSDYQEFISHLEVQQKISRYRLMPNTKFITNIP